MPADVFSLNSGWTGFYEYLDKRQTATITVTAFNATTSRVNVTLLEQSGVQIKLSGELLNPCLKISVRPRKDNLKCRCKQHVSLNIKR